MISYVYKLRNVWAAFISFSDLSVEVQDKMKTTVLLLLSLHLGLSNMIYRYNGIVQIRQVNGNNYELKLCSVTCPADTNPTDQNCDDEVAECKNSNQHTIESILTSHNKSCNMTMTLPTSSNSTTISSPTITPTLCTATSTTVVSTITTVAKVVTHHPADIYTMCANTYTTTVFISSSVAPTPPVNRNTAKIMQISQTVLGAMVGIFGVLLAIVSTGWVCTCWVMQKRRREMNINTTNIR